MPRFSATSDPLTAISAAKACGMQAPASASTAGASPAPESASAETPLGIVETVAGGGVGDGGPGPKAEIFLPSYAVYDEDGNLYVSAHGRVVKIDPSGVATNYAGTGTISFRPPAGYYGDGGPATQANFGNGGPEGLAFDDEGNLYIADGSNGVIRKVDTAGNISTVAGGGTPGRYGLEGGNPRDAYLWAPDGLDVDDEGNLYIADSGNCTIRMVKASDGKIYTVAGIPPGGNPAQTVTCTYTADDVPALGSGLTQPKDVRVDDDGNMYIADIGNSRIRMVDSNGIIHTVAGNGSEVDSGDGGQATMAGVGFPWHIALDDNGALYVAEYFSQRIRKVDASGIITTLAGTGAEGFSGDGGPASQATLEYPLGVAATPNGNGVAIADFGNNRVRFVDRTGNIRTLTGNGLPPRVCATPNNCAYYGNGFAGEGLEARYATLSSPLAVVVDDSGSMFITDTDNNRIREVDAQTGIMRTVVGTGEPGYSGDGGPATNAKITAPAALALDSEGRLYFGQGTVIRMVDETGRITRVAGTGGGGFSGDGGPAIDATFFAITGLAFDSSGNLYVSDNGNSRIRRIDTDGIVTTVAGSGTRGFGGDGGPATEAKVNSPWGLATDSAGNIYIADAGNGRVRMVDAEGVISTVAGNGAPGFNGDGGPATATALNFPMGVAVNGDGNVIVSDRNNCLVREVDAETGNIHAIAGVRLAFNTSNPGFLNCDFTGDGGPGTSAYTFAPAGLWFDPDGTLYFADTVNNRVRTIAVAAAPSPTPDPSPTVTPPRGVIRTTLTSSKATTAYQSPFVLSGRISADEACVGPNEIEVFRRGPSATDFESVGVAGVGASGTWKLTTSSKANGQYAARAVDSATCDGQMSPAISLSVHADVKVEVPKSCDAPERVHGEVRPNHAQTEVLLQRRRKGDWDTVDNDRLDGRSRFVLTAKNCADKYRVLWRAQDQRNVVGTRVFRF